MALEELYAPLAVMFILAVFLFPVMYLLDIIRQRIDPEKPVRKWLLIFCMAYIVAMAVYPFAVSEDFLPFNSTYSTYALVLFFTFALYLIVFNKTKE